MLVARPRSRRNQRAQRRRKGLMAIAAGFGMALAGSARRWAGRIASAACEAWRGIRRGCAIRARMILAGVRQTLALFTLVLSL